MSRHRTPIDELRRAIDGLPVHTREAMLRGIRKNEIIVGAYSDRQGGVCPMLAAHRNGGRTDYISFAKAWDRFADVKRARKATRRELLVLETHLESSLETEAGYEDLAAAISDHQSAARTRREREAAETGSWAFLRTRRDNRDAKRALARVEDERERELV
jgi:hypothetical protein